MPKAAGLRWLGTAVVMMLATMILAGLMVFAADGLEARGVWEVAAFQVMPVVAAGEPVVGFVEADCIGCRAPRLQLRLCHLSGGGCDPGARLAARDGVVRLSYSRPLPPGSYRLELLLLGTDAIGVVRTMAVAARVVDVR